MSDDELNSLIINITNIISYFGIILIIFFIGSILCSKNNKLTEGYFSVVASNSIFDLIFSLTTTFAKFDSFYKDGYYFFVIKRFDYEIHPIISKAITTGALFCANMCMYVIAIPFYVRYSLICKKQAVRYIIRISLYLF